MRVRWGIAVGVIVLAAALLAPLLARADSAPRPITLEQALEMASSTGLEIKAADDLADAARAQARSTEAHLLPTLKADIADQHWQKGYSVPFPGLGTFVIYSNHTTTYTFQALQPLSGIYNVGEASSAASKSADAAQLDAASVRAETIYRTTEAYLRLLEAIDRESIAGAAVKDLQEQEHLTKSLVSAGTLIQVDLLRVQVALASAQQDELHAKAGVGIGQATLDAAVGLPTDTALAPARVDASTLPTLPAEVRDAVDEALTKRPELRAAAARVSAANAGHRAAVADALPSLGAIAQYQKFEGFGPSNPKDGLFGGFNLSWNFWDWGAKYRDAQAARARARAAGDDLARRRRDVSLEVTRTFLDAQASYAAIAVAHAAVTQAEEAHRVTESLYQNGGATTTDVLDAQLALERARDNDTRAAYDYRVAYAAFQRAAALGQK